MNPAERNAGGTGRPMKIPDPVPGFEFDETVDLEQSPAWFLDGTHSVPPWTPMFGWFWINFCRHGLQLPGRTAHNGLQVRG